MRRGARRSAQPSGLTIMINRQVQPVYHLPEDKLPHGFRYPAAYEALVASKPWCIGAVNEDWCFIDREEVDAFLEYARQLSPGRPLVPFMRRNGEDGVACFDGLSTDGDPKVYVFTYCVDVGVGGGSLSFEKWLALIPPPDPEDIE